MFCDFPEASSHDHCVFQEKFRVHSSCVTRDPWEQRLNHVGWFCTIHVRGESWVWLTDFLRWIEHLGPTSRLLSPSPPPPLLSGTVGVRFPFFHEQHLGQGRQSQSLGERLHPDPPVGICKSCTLNLQLQMTSHLSAEVAPRQAEQVI